ncbi:MAG: hypothetical protein EBT06_12840 [Gammaproteobacteria bacterium]|nr:hypothetical protein [Gammaproteobacteria bacterium]
MSQKHPLLAASLSESLRTLIRHHLTDSPEGREALQRLAGQIIALRLLPFDRVLYLCPTGEDIQFMTEISGTPDVIITGHLPAFLEAARASASKETLKSSELSIEGSLQTAQDVQHLSRVLNIDWQRFLARYLGYRVAGSVLSTLRSGREHVRESFLALETDLSEYLREEVRLLPQKHHTETLFAEIDTLRADTDRLKARLERLESRRPSPP